MRIEKLQSLGHALEAALTSQILSQNKDNLVGVSLSSDSRQKRAFAGSAATLLVHLKYARNQRKRLTL
ncbi:hypothetical protein SATMO3_26870 [Sporomusa aerivorans]